MSGMEFNGYDMLKRCGRNRERYELLKPDSYPEVNAAQPEPFPGDDMKFDCGENLLITPAPSKNPGRITSGPTAGNEA